MENGTFVTHTVARSANNLSMGDDCSSFYSVTFDGYLTRIDLQSFVETTLTRVDHAAHSLTLAADGTLYGDSYGLYAFDKGTGAATPIGKSCYAGQGLALGPIEIACEGAVYADRDGDCLIDAEEAQNSADPADSDTDDDGLPDGEEIHFHGTSPASADTDGDGALDGTEVDLSVDTWCTRLCPDPSQADSDGDTLLDGHEIDQGSNPCNDDTDGDGVLDNWDPDPVTPQHTCSVTEEIIRSLATRMSETDLTLFEGTNANARDGRRNALVHRALTAANIVAHSVWGSRPAASREPSNPSRAC